MAMFLGGIGGGVGSCITVYPGALIVLRGKVTARQYELRDDIRTLTLHNKVREIHDCAFMHSAVGGTIKMPRVVLVGMRAFYNCQLRSVTLAACTRVGFESFAGNPLAVINIEDRQSWNGFQHAFRGMMRILNVEIPSNMVRGAVGKGVFQCSTIEDLTLRGVFPSKRKALDVVESLNNVACIGTSMIKRVWYQVDYDGVVLQHCSPPAGYSPYLPNPSCMYIASGPIPVTDLSGDVTIINMIPDDHGYFHEAARRHGIALKVLLPDADTPTAGPPPYNLAKCVIDGTLAQILMVYS